MCSTYMHPGHDEGIWATGVLRQVVVTGQLVPSELMGGKKKKKNRIFRNRHTSSPTCERTVQRQISADHIEKCTFTAGNEHEF